MNKRIEEAIFIRDAFEKWLEKENMTKSGVKTEELKSGKWIAYREGCIMTILAKGDTEIEALHNFIDCTDKYDLIDYAISQIPEPVTYKDYIKTYTVFSDGTIMEDK
jgi:hypothetical protein